MIVALVEVIKSNHQLSSRVNTVLAKLLHIGVGKWTQVYGLARGLCG